MPFTFLTFLGTGNYEEVHYITPDGAMHKSRYAQSALVKMYCIEITSVIVFLTPEARTKHWDSTNNSFKTELAQLLPAITPITIDITTVSSEETLWQLFNRVYDAIPENSEIIFDITHAFRHLPILGLVILNYARSLKNIKITAIYYGAFEARNNTGAPIIDLTRIDRLLQWSNAVEFYLKTGNAYSIDKLVNETVGFIRNQTDQPDPVLNLERSFSNALKYLLPVLSTCRSKEIIAGNIFTTVRERLQTLMEQKNIYIKPLEPLYNRILQTVIKFENNSMANLLLAVHLCIEYSLVQQGITLLEESVISIILYTLGIDDIYNKDNRYAVSRFFQFIALPGKNYTHPRDEEQYRAIGEKLDTSRLAKEVAIPFDKLRDCRNDISHAGYNDSAAGAEKFLKTLTDSFIDILNVFNESKDIVESWLLSVTQWLLEQYRC